MYKYLLRFEIEPKISKNWTLSVTLVFFYICSLSPDKYNGTYFKIVLQITDMVMMEIENIVPREGFEPTLHTIQGLAC